LQEKSIILIQKQRDYRLTLIMTLALSLWYCEKPEEETVANSESLNTLSDLTIGSGTTGAVSEYFYNFDNDLDAEFYLFSQSKFSYSYDKYLTTLSEEPPKMTLKSFPDYLVAITPNSSELLARYPIDSLSVQDIRTDSVTLTSTQFKNVESIEWDLDAEPSFQRYKPNNSDWQQADTTITYIDTVEISAYYAVIDTPLIEAGIMFVDSSEWRDTSYAFVNETPLSFSNAFVFIKKQISADSLFYRVNTDCNDNNAWDVGETQNYDYNNDGDLTDVVLEYEDKNNNGQYDTSADSVIFDYNNDGEIGLAFEFTDRGNSLWDPEEAYYDVDSDGAYTLSEPYQDRNCNDVWDGAEDYTDANANGIYDEGEVFVDRGNGLYDVLEVFTWVHADEDSTKGLFEVDEVPNNLIVDWANFDSPDVKMEINLNDDITDRHGNIFSNLIEEVSFTDVKQAQVDDIDSLVTLYTHDVVANIADGVNPEDYYIAKSEWTREMPGTGEIVRGYRYHLYREDGDIIELVYPGYFLMPGYYYNENQVANGFWHKTELEEEILLYTYNGELRDGERVEWTDTDTTGIAIYTIEKSYQVDNYSSGISVAAGIGNRGWVQNDSIFCVRDSSYFGSTGEFEISDCPGLDTTYYDCFRITSEITTTMLGSGVEFGQRVITYLVKGQGVVKEEVYIRWTEHPYFTDGYEGLIDENGQVWIGLSRIELSAFNEGSSGGLFRQLTRPVEMIDMDRFDAVPDFNFDPFKPAKSAGIQTIELNY